MAALKPRLNARDSDEVRGVLEGRAERLPMQKSSKIRVFFSSTFTDMTVERNILMKDVVPYLTEMCQDRGLEFEVVDMRWGVRDDAQVDHTTTALLMREIKKCQLLSAGPNFVMFLGDRYGSYVLPSQIASAEFKALKSAAAGRDTRLLEKWYVMDSNAEPPVYQLQPITSNFPYYNNMDPTHQQLYEKAREDWQCTERDLRDNLKQLAQDAFTYKKISCHQYDKYFESVTEMEIHAGITDVPTTDKVLCFQRRISGIDLQDKLAGRFVDLTESGEIDLDAEVRRKKLQNQKVPNALPPDHIFKNNVCWTDNGINLLFHQEYLTNLCEEFKEVMLEKIDKCLDAASRVSKDELYYEILRNLHFCQQKCEVFYGREDELKNIHEKSMHLFSVPSNSSEDAEESLIESVTDENHNKSKSNCSVMSENEELEGDGTDEDVSQVEDETSAAEQERKAVADTCESMGVKFHYGDAHDDFESDPDKNPQLRLTWLPEMPQFKRPVIVYGCSGSGKTSLMARVGHLSSAWMPNSFTIVRFFGTSPHCSHIRDILFGLCQQIAKLYGITSATYLDLDSEFQFLVSYFNALLWRIDCKTNPLVIILDSVDQLHPTDHAHSLSWIPKKLPPNVTMVVSMIPSIHNCLQNCQVQFPFPDQFIELSPFAESDATEVMKILCKRSHRSLTRPQKNFLLKKFVNCPQPLYLKLIVDQALTWYSYTQIKDVQLGDTIEAAIHDLFDKLERNHGNILITHAFGYLAAASQGLSDNEMEDLLSLDDEVLQDTYLYHLPPDDFVIRLPPLLWKRISDDIREYIVERKSGNGFVLTWYHRQFREVAELRYLPPDRQTCVHTLLCEYFTGRWYRTVKPLELFTIKKGWYPSATRRVPPQPLLFEKGGYNIRKLQELPYHLIKSHNFSQFRDLACCFQWLYAKCHTMSLSSVVMDIKMALASLAVLEIKDEIRDDIKFILDMVNLGNDSIRKDVRNLAVQIVAQIAPDVSSNHLSSLYTDAHTWLVTNDNPHLIPQSVCLPRPGGILMSSANVDVHILGSDRDFHNCMFLNEEKQKLFVIQQQSRSQFDNLRIYDVQDNLTCMQVNELPFNVRALQLTGQNRFLMLQVYDHMDKYNPVYHSMLFEGTTSSPVTITERASTVSVSDSGKLLVYSKDKVVTIACPDKTNQTFKNKHIMETGEETGFMIISPNEKYLITINTSNKQLLWDTKTGQRLATLGDSDKESKIDFSFSEFAPHDRNCHITANNTFIHRGWSYDTSSVLFFYELPSGKLLDTLESPSTHYAIDIVVLDKKEQFVIYGTSSDVVINGDMNKHATIAEVSTTTIKSTCKCVTGPYSDIQLCGEHELLVVAAVQDKADVYILSAGLRTELKPDAELVFSIPGHSQGVLQVIITSDEKFMFSAAKDNAIKLWDFSKILASIEHRRYLTECNNVQPDGVCEENDSHAKSESRRDDVISDGTESKLRHWDDDSAVDRVGRTLSLVISRNCETLYITTEKGFLLKRNLKDRTTTVINASTDEPTNHLLLSSNDKYLCAVIGGKILVVDTFTDNLLYTLEPRGPVSSIAEGGDILVAGQAGMEAKGRIWSLQTGKQIRDFEFLYSLYKVAVNNAGTKMCVTLFDVPMLLSTADDNTDDAAHHQQPDTMMYSCSAMSISPNDSLAAAGSSDGTTRVISAHTGKYLFRLNQRSSVTNLAFSPDNKSLLTAGYRSVYVWDMHDGHLDCKLTRHHDFVVNLRFAQNGRFLVTSGRDKMIVVWNMEERVSVCVFLAHCHVDVLDVADDMSYIVYGSEVESLVAVLEPNNVLKSMAEGCYIKTLSDPILKAQFLALSFSGQKVKKHTTSACCIL